MRWFSAGLQESGTVIYGPRRIMLRSLGISFIVPWPGNGFAWVYNRPIAVRIEQDEMPSHTLPVINYTRLAIIGVFIYSAIIANLFWRFLDGRK